MCENNINAKERNKDEIVSDINCLIKQISSRMLEVESLLEELSKAPKSDWISVKHAAEMLDVSPSLLYRKVDAGLLTCKHVGSRKLLNIKELLTVND